MVVRRGVSAEVCTAVRTLVGKRVDTPVGAHAGIALTLLSVQLFMAWLSEQLARLLAWLWAWLLAQQPSRLSARMQEWLLHGFHNGYWLGCQYGYLAGKA